MKISTSILSSDNRILTVEKLNRTHTSYIHVDVMDGDFVPDKQFYYIGEIKGINTISKYPLDIHLMVNDPAFYLNQLHEMNIEFVTFHVEIGNKKSNDKIIEQIHGLGYKVGLAIKPNTDVSVLEEYLDEIDMILIMSVEPGKGGQKFIHSTVDKIKEVKKLMGDRNILTEVDGGINNETIDMVKDVDIAVVGSYITSSDNYYERIEYLLNFGDNVIVKDHEIEKIYFGEKVFITYFILVLIRSLYGAIFGWKGLCIWMCGYDYGISVFFLLMLFWLYLSPLFLFLFLIAIVLNLFSKVCRCLKNKNIISRYGLFHKVIFFVELLYIIGLIPFLGWLIYVVSL